MTDRSSAFRSRGSSAVFAVRAAFAPGAEAALHLEVEHCDSREEAWSVAGAFPVVTASGTSTVPIAGIKALYRLSWRLTGATSVRIHFPEPAWA